MQRIPNAANAGSEWFSEPRVANARYKANSLFGELTGLMGVAC
jgi:hypothetical protein